MGTDNIQSLERAVRQGADMPDPTLRTAFRTVRTKEQTIILNPILV